MRLIGHAIESQWRSPVFASGKRELCQLRACLHFFISNLLYFLQVYGVSLSL